MLDYKGKFFIIKRKDLEKVDPASIQHRVQISLNGKALSLSLT